MTGDKLRKIIKSKMELYGYTADYMAIKLHLNRSAWYKRLQHPERMRFEDICKLDKILNLGVINDQK